MGTNLNQVFILNTANLETGTDYDSVTAGDAGIWTITSGGTDTYVATALYATTVDTDTSNADDTTVGALTVANPLWLYNDFQIVQGVSGNPIASPIISSRNVRRVTFEPFVASVRHAIVTGTLVANKEYDVKFVVRTAPTAQLNFHDPDSSGYIDLSGGGFDFPLGAFTHGTHKVLHISAEGSTATAAGDALVANIANSSILNALFTASNSSGDVTITARHAGVTFELIAENLTDSTFLANASTTVYKPGVGNDWQVLGDEIRTNYRVGNFNRMYLPQNPSRLTKADYQYHKITLEYEHNWPNSTGIAPAGALNQAVIYAADSSAAMAAGDTNIDAAFALANVTAKQSFVW